MKNTIPTQPKILGGTLGSSAGAISAMLLSSITYCKDIPHSLDTYIPEWKAVWLPTKSINGQFAFIAFNGSQYAIAIRGSILEFSIGSFDNWFRQDFNIFKQVDWEYTNNTTAKPRVSKGTADALKNLIGLTDEKGDTIESFLMKNAIPNGTPLCITGHSLGAYLSTAFAPYLRYQIQKANQPIPKVMSVFTFASPTAGNKAFAEEYDSLFPLSWRFYNQLDLIPFSASNIKGMANLFPPPGIAAKDVTYKNHNLSQAINLISKTLAADEFIQHSHYSQTNLNRGSVALNKKNKIFDVKTTKPLEAWFKQVGAQHDHNAYLEFLGAPKLDYHLIKLQDDVKYT